jgi:hypothetical protein
MRSSIQTKTLLISLIFYNVLVSVQSNHKQRRRDVQLLPVRRLQRKRIADKQRQLLKELYKTEPPTAAEINTNSNTNANVVEPKETKMLRH